MNRPHIWLRAETKPLEQRRALSPRNAKKLIDAGFQVTVERSTQSVFDDREFAELGCDLVEKNAWKQQAPLDAYILGLKELEASADPLKHRHIYFAHAYKEQEGWQDVLNQFKTGGGSLYDLEYLVNEDGRRVAAFGFWAGFCGAAVSLQAWCAQQENETLSNLRSHKNQQAMVEQLKDILADRQPRMIVIGANGRCGQGALSMASKLELEVTQWDIEETKTQMVNEEWEAKERHAEDMAERWTAAASQNPFLKERIAKFGWQEVLPWNIQKHVPNQQLGKERKCLI